MKENEGPSTTTAPHCQLRSSFAKLYHTKAILFTQISTYQDFVQFYMTLGDELEMDDTLYQLINLSRCMYMGTTCRKAEKK